MADNFPISLPPSTSAYTVLGVAAIASALSVSYNKQQWWNNNLGFEDNRWILSLTPLLVLALILTLLYIYIWQRAVSLLANPGLSLLFASSFSIFFCGYIMLFHYRDPKTALYLLVAALLIVAYLLGYLFRYNLYYLSAGLLVILLAVSHFIYQVSCVRI